MDEMNSEIIGPQPQYLRGPQYLEHYLENKYPPKVRIFTWRLATESLAVQTNRFRCIVGPTPICNVCGADDEMGFHVAQRCTFVRALWHELKDVWNLPPESEISYTERDWVLVLLDKAIEDLRQKQMLFWWRVWHHRNDVIFAKGKAKISHSGQFLQN